LSQIAQPAFLQKIRNGSEEAQEWKDGIAGLYLYCLMQAMQPEEELRDKICGLADALSDTEDPVCVRTTQAVMGIFAYMLNKRENLGRWLLAAENKEASEMTYTELVFRIRGCLMLRQYGKAGRLLQVNMPYLKRCRMTRLYAEVLFQQAVVNWHMEQHGQALQNVIESFLVNGSCRYVGFYTIYGNAGVEVLEAYMEWMQKNIPGGWKRKKKYNYGNVLRMPVEDYLDVILRKAKRTAQKRSISNTLEQGESLTMMETIVLQAICQGLSNAEISEQQNLKITTVKSHIYSMYKKLGVKNRMQAALRGRELGIV
ncbi:MAG: LuxR C-terminal-related transcriptional regulator, partial [Eubacteriales bacterium]|nr:LuxR C-terminal-related transcriptional regulator [Eubacteriales bacterium]